MNDIKQVIVFPRGQLSAKDKERLTKVGIIAVEADEPSKVVCCLPMAPLIGADDILVCAMQALSQGTYSKDSYFLQRIAERVIAADPAKKEPK